MRIRRLKAPFSHQHIIILVSSSSSKPFRSRQEQWQKQLLINEENTSACRGQRLYPMRTRVPKRKLAYFNGYEYKISYSKIIRPSAITVQTLNGLPTMAMEIPGTTNNNNQQCFPFTLIVPLHMVHLLLTYPLFFPTSLTNFFNNFTFKGRFPPSSHGY